MNAEITAKLVTSILQKMERICQIQKSAAACLVVYYDGLERMIM